MKSRAISALVFGLIFGIVFTTISLFTPPITKAPCGDRTTYEIFNKRILGPQDCVGGGSTKSIGFPFGSKVHKSQGTINPNSYGYVPDKPGYQISPLGLTGNLIAYWLLGFLFFFIFSRSRNTGKGKKSKKETN